MAPAAGPVIWARCDSPAEAALLPLIAARLAEDGDRPRLHTSLGLPAPPGAAPHPQGRRDLRRYLADHDPVLLLAIGGSLDAATLQECEARDLPVILVNCRPEPLRELTGGWFRSRSRASLGHVRLALAADSGEAEALLRAGVAPDRLVSDAQLEPETKVLPYNERDRHEIAEMFRNRPVWLARRLPLVELDTVVAAHRHAARRAHRLLTCIIPAHRGDSDAMAETLRGEGFIVGQREAGTEPEEAMQFYLADVEGEDGLWLRLSPMAYAGGSLSGRGSPDPMEAAALGSVVLHGMQTQPFKARYQRLIREGASLPLPEADRLGPGVDQLLSAQRTAEMATAGWDVASRGAEALDRVVSAIQTVLDGSR